MMKSHLLMHDYREAAAALRGKFPAPSHVDQTIDHDAVVIAPDGSILAVLIRQQISTELYKPAYEDWKTVDELPSNRATAVGSPSLPRCKVDGTLSERRGVPKLVLEILKGQDVGQGTLGYLDATPDQPCHKTPLSIKRPEILDQHKRLAWLIHQRPRSWRRKLSRDANKYCALLAMLM